MSGAQQLLDLPGPRISRVTIGRLHNLGNYEHVRYEVTVELPPGTPPASVMRALGSMLDKLEPRSPQSIYEVSNAQRTLAKPEPKLADFIDRTEERGYSRTPHEHLAEATRERERAAEVLARWKAWRERSDAALKRFDELGGTKVFTDAKDDWDDQ